jgi:hypothetical protein
VPTTKDLCWSCGTVQQEPPAELMEIAWHSLLPVLGDLKFQDPRVRSELNNKTHDWSRLKPQTEEQRRNFLDTLAAVGEEERRAHQTSQSVAAVGLDGSQSRFSSRTLAPAGPRGGPLASGPPAPAAVPGGPAYGQNPTGQSGSGQAGGQSGGSGQGSGQGGSRQSSSGRGGGGQTGTGQNARGLGRGRGRRR